MLNKQKIRNYIAGLITKYILLYQISVKIELQQNGFVLKKETKKRMKSLYKKLDSLFEVDSNQVALMAYGHSDVQTDNVLINYF